MKKIQKISALLLCIFLMLTACKEETLTIQDYLNLGQKYLEELNYDEAIVAFQKVIELDANELRAYTGLAEVHLQSGQEEQAGQILKEGMNVLLQAEERDRSEFVDVAEKYYTSMDEIEALAEFFKRMTELEPEQEVYREKLQQSIDLLVERYVAKAEELLKQGDTDGALEYFQKAYEWNSDETLYIRIQALKNGGEYVDEHGERYDVYGRKTKSLHYDGDGNLGFYSVNEYNEQGRQITWTSYTPDGSVISEFQDYRYDEDGRAIRGFYYDAHSGSVEGYIDFTYDEKGNVIQEQRYDQDGTRERYSINFYNDKGEKIRTEARLPDGSLTSYMESQYDEKGHRTGYQNYDADGTLTSYGEHYYDEKGSWIGDAFFDADGTVISKTIHSPDQ